MEYNNKNLPSKERYSIADRVIKITIGLNILLTFIKLAAGVIAGSTAMVADAIHSASDIFSSVAVIIGIKIAQKPEDISHPYGHEKAESIVAILLASLLIATGGGIGWSAVTGIFAKDIQPPGLLALYVAVLSISVKEGMYRYTILNARKINSSALAADAWHHRSDAFSSIAALIGIGGARVGYPFMDPLAGFVVSILVIKAGIDIFKKAYYELMDTSAAPEVLRQMSDIVLKVDGVQNISELKTRQHGSGLYVDLKICVDKHLPVYKGHDIAHNVERAITDSINSVKDVLVHVNPCYNIAEDGRKTRECSQCEGKREVKEDKDGE